MKKIKIAAMNDIKPGTARQVRLLGRYFAVFNINGTYYGLEGMCKHMKAPLCGGELDGTIVTCPMHQWKYDVATGACLTEDWAALKTYPVELHDQDIYLILS